MVSKKSHKDRVVGPLPFMAFLMAYKLVILTTETSKWLVTMVIVSPISTVLPVPFMAFLWLINGGDPITTETTWDDPPSKAPPLFP